MVKNLPASGGNMGSIPGLEKSPEEGNSHSLQYSGPENSTDYIVIGKDSDAGRDWGQEEKGTTEDEMAGWHHCLDGR